MLATSSSGELLRKFLAKGDSHTELKWLFKRLINRLLGIADWSTKVNVILHQLSLDMGVDCF